jgi:hypothetical protein
VLLGGSADPGQSTDLVAAAFPVADFEVQTVATRLEFTADSDSTAQHTDSAALEVRLTDAGGTPLDGQPVDISFGPESHRATTDATGTARVVVQIDELPGDVPVSASFAGAPPLAPSSAAATFTVVHEDSNLAVSASGIGVNRIIRAHLTDADDAASGLAARAVTLHVEGAAPATTRTDTDGRASFTAPPGARGGSRTFVVRFDGDAGFLPSEGQAAA